jgi:hypothetical protein
LSAKRGCNHRTTADDWTVLQILIGTWSAMRLLLVSILLGGTSFAQVGAQERNRQRMPGHMNVLLAEAEVLRIRDA